MITHMRQEAAVVIEKTQRHCWIWSLMKELQMDQMKELQMDHQMKELQMHQMKELQMDQMQVLQMDLDQDIAIEESFS